MLTYTLARGTALRLGRAGPALRLHNSPLLHYWLNPGIFGGANAQSPTFHAATVLIGYDRIPTQAAYDAILPPDCELALNVPATVSTVILLWESATASTVTLAPAATPIILEAEWLGCEVQGGLRSVRIPVPLDQGASKYIHGRDFWGGLWPIASDGGLLDQGLNFGWAPHTRPPIVPSITDTIHAVTVANTIFTLQGPLLLLAASNTAFKVVHRIYVSVSAACLLVIGTTGLTVGSPGVEEVYRGLLQAGVPFPIEFGEGMEVSAMGAAGPWKAYTSVAVTLDATVIGG